MKNINWTEKQKVRFLEIIMDKIRELFPNGNADIMVHDVDFDKIDSKWIIEKHKRGTTVYCSAHRTKDPFDITLFGIDGIDYLKNKKN